MSQIARTPDRAALAPSPPAREPAGGAVGAAVHPRVVSRHRTGVTRRDHPPAPSRLARRLARAPPVAQRRAGAGGGMASGDGRRLERAPVCYEAETSPGDKAASTIPEVSRP